ncbi:oxidoreductase family protein [Psychrosphaera algicola]|uniref:DUF1679 domain-containing protein n=1 Tax=Psychrosphaera algicola TaxID=3023714 RepID=A0ABT5FHY2_9GAMM|nr:oxidoreductase family protein [Psychrosphaera sp. G1-22]MDC2890799.1 DUF1679 domain-containing protein [Psychrosphaera sp. G1-22]
MPNSKLKIAPHLAQLKLLLDDSSIVHAEQLQSLWSGYGEVARYKSLDSGASFIVKNIDLSPAKSHPRGWNSNIGHQRKLRSYQVETSFYQAYAAHTDKHCYVPQLIAQQHNESSILLVLEDLDALGYNQRLEVAQWHTFKIAIRWLAYFHGKFMFSTAESLWPIGTYWHYQTRQDEYNKMAPSPLKEHAQEIDEVLNKSQFKTLLHGDAKFQNLCFHQNNLDVAAVDFQYVGLGHGVKDLTCLAASCLNNQQLFEYDDLILTEYLTSLKSALNYYQHSLDFEQLSEEYQQLYPLAWADIYRFLLGWNPQSIKISDYMIQKADLGLNQIRFL